MQHNPDFTDPSNAEYETVADPSAPKPYDFQPWDIVTFYGLEGTLKRVVTDVPDLFVVWFPNRSPREVTVHGGHLRLVRRGHIDIL